MGSWSQKISFSQEVKNEKFILWLAKRIRNVIKEVLIINIIGWVLVGILVVVAVCFPDDVDILFFFDDFNYPICSGYSLNIYFWQ